MEEELVSEEVVEEPIEESKDLSGGSFITGGAIGTNNQDNMITRFVRFIEGLFS